MASFRALACSVALLAIAACGYPVRNEEASTVDDRYGYRPQNLPHGTLPGTMVVVTASGGGTRATALALSVLRALDRVGLPGGGTLADEIDVLSSVSGGSVAAAQFALRGRGGFDALERDFVRQDGIAALLGAGLNPLGLARLATNGTERIDLLVDHLDQTLFHGARYADLLAGQRRPYLILNAADMVEGVPFPFTQRKLGLLCSDLLRMPLATAVAASAAFPVALSPITLTNYQPCAATRGIVWPPASVTAPLGPEPESFTGPNGWYESPQPVTTARSELAYALGRNAPADRQKHYVHLLDGGIADNLGVFEPFRMLTGYNTEYSILNDIASGSVTKLVFIVVNARSFAASALDRDRSTPGIVDMLKASIDAPLDRATASTAARLADLLKDTFRQMELADPTSQARFRQLAANTAVVAVDFDAIPNTDCRRKFQGIATSWTLSAPEIDAVLAVGGALLAADPAFADVLRLTDAGPPPLPRLEDVCRSLAF